MISWLERHNKISWSAAIIIALLIFYISSLTFGGGSGSGSNVNAVIYHIFAFFFLAFFLSISLIKRKRTRLIFLSIIISILYGISDEIHQLFVPGRHFALFDIFLNSVGILSASFLYMLHVRYRNSTNQESFA